ncbi:MAG: ThiF family adenylyltransferase, partial [Thermoplasmata archaeon]|nr:ThiF family adenylyltransferase [Thermoplasmata archaeon]
MDNHPGAAGLITVVGLGAVGSNATWQAVLDGGRRLRIVDRDVVEPQNLERASLYQEADIGNPKAVAAAARLRSLNPATRLEVRVKDAH